MNKSIAWLSLAAASLALSGCGGGEEAAEPKPAAKKKGDKDVVNPWAPDAPAGTPAEAPPQKKGKVEEAGNPWAKEGPKPAAT